MIFNVNMFFLCDLAVYIGNAALPREVLEQIGTKVDADYQSIYLDADEVALVLDALEFCCHHPKSLAQARAICVD